MPIPEPNLASAVTPPEGMIEGPIPGTICSYLGLFDDRSLVRSLPTASHRCYLLNPPGAPEAAHQCRHCLGGEYAACLIYQTAGQNQPVAVPPRASRRMDRLITLAGILLLVAVVGIAAYFGMEWLRAPISLAWTAATQPPWTPTPYPTAVEPARTISLLPTITPTPSAPGLIVPSGGKLLALEPDAGDTGWWSDQDGRRGNLGDSFLYAGTRDGAHFMSALRFDLHAATRGAEIAEATLRLTGLRDARTQTDPNASWIVEFVPEAALPNLARADYQALAVAPASIAFPRLPAAQIAAGDTIELPLDTSARKWLAQQLVDGATGVIVRIQAQTTSANSLFAWDSGSGPTTAGFTPQLILSVGPPPSTPPPTPTKPFLVATLTPEPENLMTAVALAATATQIAATIGTYTPSPYEVYTPTPYPENLATQQAIAVAQGKPPIMLPTPTPANAAEATEQALYPTLVAVTTGTFTPTPTEWVTPVVILPSPPAANIATEAARMAETDARATQWDYTTPTPLPYNAVVAVYVFATATPGSKATAIAQHIAATAESVVYGTPTALPFYAVVITPSPTVTPTPVPLLVDSTVTPTPTPTAPPDTLPAEVRGGILFKSNRSGTEATYLLDPATGAVDLVTQSWVYPLAREQLTTSTDGRAFVYVESDGARSRLNLVELEYNLDRPITVYQGLNYDPAWSPNGEYIAYASNLPGNDEIFRIRRPDGEPEQLTFNTWEWDKHPTWSPDGSQIVFFSNRDSGHRQLWIMNADGSDPRNLSNNAFEDWDPVWVR